MNRIYSPQQAAFLEARARTVVLHDAVRQRMRETGLTVEANLDAYCEVETILERELGVLKAIDAETAARRNLLNWARRQVEQMPGGRRPEITDLFEKANRNPWMIDRLIEIAMGLTTDQ